MRKFFKNIAFLLRTHLNPGAQFGSKRGIMKRLIENLNPDTSIPVARPREGSRTYALDSFKKSYAQVPRGSRRSNNSMKSAAQAVLPLPRQSSTGYSRPARGEFSKLSEVMGLQEGGSGGSEDDRDDQANNAETEELMRISKNALMHYPTDAILQRHQNNGKSWWRVKKFRMSLLVIV